MKVLVTGGAGFIGSHIVDALIIRGNQVAVVDDLSTGKAENLNPEARFYQLDIRQPELETVIETERPEVIFHEAAQMDVRRSVREPRYDADVNLLGTLNMLDSAARHGVRKVIYASTGGAVYGNPISLPVTEDHPIRPVSHYGVSKHTVEHYLFLYKHLYGLDFTVLRYPNVFGPRQNPKGEAGVVAIFSEQFLDGEQPTIFGDGSKSRDYVYVADVVAANMAAIDEGSGETLNIGSAIETTDLQVFEAVRDAVGSNTQPRFAAVRPGEVDRICLDGSRAKAVLGWEPHVNFATGVQSVVNWVAASRPLTSKGKTTGSALSAVS